MNVAKLRLEAVTPLSLLPEGHIFLEIIRQKIEGRLFYGGIQGTVRSTWSDDGNNFDLRAIFSFPEEMMKNLDISLHYDLIKGLTLIPVGVTFNGRLSIGKIQHWIMSIELGRAGKKVIAFNIGSIRPVGTSSFVIDMAKEDNELAAKVTLLHADSSYHGSLIYYNEFPEHELIVLLRSNWKSISRRFKFWNQGINLGWSLSHHNVDDVKYESEYILNWETELNLDRMQQIVHTDAFITSVDSYVVTNSTCLQLRLQKVEKERINLELQVKCILDVTLTGILLHVEQDREATVKIRLNTRFNKDFLELTLTHDVNDLFAWSYFRVGYEENTIKGLGNPLQFELTAENLGKKFIYKTSMQKQMKPEKSVYTKGGDIQREADIRKFYAMVQTTHHPASTEYKAIWQTDLTTNEGLVVFEELSSGTEMHMSYERQMKKRVQPKLFYKLKVIKKLLPSLIFWSLTLSSSTAREKSITYTHSKEESSSRMAFDVFEMEKDQFIISVTERGVFHLNAGQINNTFLELGWEHSDKLKGKTNEHLSILADLIGQRTEIMLGQRADKSSCLWMQVDIANGEYSATEVELCFDPIPKLTIELFASEKNTGIVIEFKHEPNFGDGRASNFTLGIGLNKLLRFSKALELGLRMRGANSSILLTGSLDDMKKFTEELYRGRAEVRSILRKFGNLNFTLKGKTEFSEMADSLRTLLFEGHQLSQIFFKDLFLMLKNELELKTVDVMKKLRSALESSLAAIRTVTHHIEWSAKENIFVATNHLMSWERNHEKLNFLQPIPGFQTAARLFERIQPKWILFTSTIKSLKINDEQSLYFLTSRIMSKIHSMVGRHHGLSGFVRNDLLMTIEKELATKWRWSTARENLRSLVANSEEFFNVKSEFSRDDSSFFLLEAYPLKSIKIMDFIDHIIRSKIPLTLGLFRAQYEDWTTKVKYHLSWNADGRAYIIGWDHAISWDGKLLSPLLSNSCSHLLVLLTLSEPGTAVAMRVTEAEVQVEKFFQILSGGDEVILGSNLQIFLNGQLRREKEIVQGNLLITWSKERADIISSDGLRLSCFKSKDYCEVQVSWRNFGGTAGLLGIFDREPNTDVMTSTWEMPSSEIEWSSSWRVDLSTECDTVPVADEIDRNQDSICSILYDDKDADHLSFGTCKQMVNPKPFKDTCMGGRLCQSEAAFSDVCKDRWFDNVNPTLQQCESCSSNPEERRDVSNLPHEIVILGDYTCFGNIDHFITYLRKDTDRNQLRLMRRQMTLGEIEDADFDEVLLQNSQEHFGPIIDNILEVDFSYDSIKTIVLMDCSSSLCHMLYARFLEDLAAISEKLVSRGVVLYTITEDNFSIENPSKVKKKYRKQLLGVDGKTVYLKAHAKKLNLKGKKSLRRFVDPPKDNMCADLSIRSNGAVFSSKYVKKSKKSGQRKSLQQLIAFKILQEPNSEYLRCRVCECHSACVICPPSASFGSQNWPHLPNFDPVIRYD